MNKKIKFKGHLHFYRKQIEELQNLTDAEYRLLELYIFIVDWDKRHDNFATTYANNKEIKKWYLPKWSQQKIGRAKKRLEAKGLIVIKRPDKRTEIVSIPNFHKYQKPIQETESETKEVESEVPKVKSTIPKVRSTELTKASDVLRNQPYIKPK